MHPNEKGMIDQLWSLSFINMKYSELKLMRTPKLLCSFRIFECAMILGGRDFPLVSVFQLLDMPALKQRVQKNIAIMFM